MYKRLRNHKKMAIIIVLIAVVLSTLGYFGYMKASEWKNTQDKIAKDKETQAQIRTDITRTLKDIEANKPAENTASEVKADYYSGKLDAEYRLGNFDTAIKDFLALQTLRGEENISSYELLLGAKAYAKKGDIATAKQLVDKAEAAVKRQQTDPINYAFYMDQVDEVRTELFE